MENTFPDVTDFWSHHKNVRSLPPIVDSETDFWSDFVTLTQDRKETQGIFAVLTKGAMQCNKRSRQFHDDMYLFFIRAGYFKQFVLNLDTFI